MLKQTSRKGQMKIQQMAFMLIAVTLFFVLAGLFVLTIVFSGLKNSAELVAEREALLLVSKLADSPEFSCGDAFGSSRTNCVDVDKVEALQENIAKYSGFWGVEGIEIINLNTGEETIIVDSQGGTGVSNFVALCRKQASEQFGIENKCGLGKLIVTYNEDEENE